MMWSVKRHIHKVHAENCTFFSHYSTVPQCSTTSRIQNIGILNKSLKQCLKNVVTANALDSSIISSTGTKSSPPNLVEITTPQKLPSLAVFVSGSGSNFKAIHAAILEGKIKAEIAAVVSDVPSCGGVQYAQACGIPTLTYPIPKKGGSEGLNVEQIVEALKVKHSVDYVILAGYLKLIPSSLVAAYPRAMLNIHPGLLPSFGGKGMYGERVHKAVVASGVRFTGPSVHFVDEEFDTGAILAQRVVPVYPTDTAKDVAARVLKQEHVVYPEAVAALVDGRITWRDDGIPIMWSAH
ncbi:hypothetical protein CEUSTIGMA_g811.t1 [Chlamydomonas eustigma]|uniref:phosphoribosylglycinamide formyltransferase 1 n=1 Tax=Chlamydomonas eustigma TaxID=1157962 RepID=A0A250WRB0_9CHLO|nr:hypothetical protein CEUSTIGMA_g811.t1 [Chlamydomonas eustigma]|eukprot:GAX73358.1 hypothetical protein CEUSTIGMA_g811.t1 [Chlamydomonas eustigma]